MRTLAPRAIDANNDGDGLPDGWETDTRLDPTSAVEANGAHGDLDGDGMANTRGSHPKKAFRLFLAEGATGTLFDERLGLLNIHDSAAHSLVRCLRRDKQVISRRLRTGPHSRPTIDTDTTDGLADAECSTVIESDVSVVVDRTMSWDARGYGSHAETALLSPSRTWYLARGATHSGFALYYLFHNPNSTRAEVQVTDLLPSPAEPLVRTYPVPGESRFNIRVDDIPELSNTDVSAVIHVLNDAPIIGSHPAGRASPRLYGFALPKRFRYETRLQRMVST